MNSLLNPLVVVISPLIQAGTDQDFSIEVEWMWYKWGTFLP